MADRLELSDHELRLNDYSLQTASVDWHSLQRDSAITLSTLRRESHGLHLVQGLVNIEWLDDHFGHITHSVQSSQVIWLRNGISSKVLYLHELRYYYLMQAESDVIKL